MKTNLLSKSDTAVLIEKITTQWKNIKIPHVKNIRVYYLDNAQLIEIEGMRILEMNDIFLPYLGDVNALEKFANVTVDMGAVRFMCKGANVMRPGIINNTKFNIGDIVCIIEESQHKFLAVGHAIVSSEQLKDMPRGEVIKNMHYVSDKNWELVKEIDAKTPQ